VSVVYRILLVALDASYVGSSGSVGRRFANHRSALRRGVHPNRKLQAAWLEHGEAAFRFGIIENVAPGLCAVEREQFWIDHLDAVERGFNLQRRAASSHGYLHSEETRARMSEAKRGRRSNRAGVPLTPEQNEALQAGRKAYVHTDEHRARVSAFHRGRKRSDETRARMSAGRKRAAAERAGRA
jgi:group I intron endonuclease